MKLLNCRHCQCLLAGLFYHMLKIWLKISIWYVRLGHVLIRLEVKRVRPRRRIKNLPAPDSRIIGKWCTSDDLQLVTQSYTVVLVPHSMISYYHTISIHHSSHARPLRACRSDTKAINAIYTEEKMKFTAFSVRKNKHRAFPKLLSISFQLLSNNAWSNHSVAGAVIILEHYQKFLQTIDFLKRVI